MKKKNITVTILAILLLLLIGTSVKAADESKIMYVMRDKNGIKSMKDYQINKTWDFYAEYDINVYPETYIYYTDNKR